MSTIEERVQRGAAWLDEVRPGWRDAIEPTRLNLNHNQNCVLGQVFHDPRGEVSGFALGCAAKAETFSGRCVSGIDLGFIARTVGVTIENTNSELDALRVAWLRVILGPRAPRHAATEVSGA